MNRMVIFVFYDFEGCVDGYVKYLLQSLITIAGKIVIVSNTNLDMKGRKEFEAITKYIYERGNRGFDAGAYKDVFMFYLKDEEWRNWDEVIMLNDTFYGPVYPWQEVFDKMDCQDVDFWGMTKREGHKRKNGILIPTHIQSYFLAVRKKVLLSEDFRFFWENMNYPEKLDDAVLNFEVKFTDYFSKCKYKYLTYVDVMGDDYLINKKESPYLHYAVELLATTRMPLIKRKALTIANFEKACDAFEYITDNTKYDVELIKKHMMRLDINHKLTPYGYMEIDDFCKKFSKIYIYGHGKQGCLVEAYFKWRGHSYEKFIVTTKEGNDDDNVMPYSDLMVDGKTGILLALGKNNTEQVLPEIVKDIPRTQLLVPRF